MIEPTAAPAYRGRIAPSPTGYLHAGHALTFWTAQQRALGGTLVLRIEDIDCTRCRPEFTAAILEDLHWFGLVWREGPDLGGPFGPYMQSQRDYLSTWRQLRDAGSIYPCTCSRKDVLAAVSAPHGERPGMVPADEEPIYPGTCRGNDSRAFEHPAGVNWRFRVPDGIKMSFEDGRMGIIRAIGGVDFGDFLVWRKDNIPAYQLAVVADDAAMRITEVVRGEDLLTSTFRQLLLYRALGLVPPSWYHSPLVRDESGNRLAKRNDALSLRVLRHQGITPEEIRARYYPPGL